MSDTDAVTMILKRLSQAISGGADNITPRELYTLYAAQLAQKGHFEVDRGAFRSIMTDLTDDIRQGDYTFY